MRVPFVTLCCLLALAASRAESYDLVIRHGRVVNGTGAPAFYADVAVKNGRITAVGRVETNTGPEINATGMIVAPGFIDVHTHADKLGDGPDGQNYLRMGVTTVIAGNCGNSTLDIGKFYRDLAQKPASLNIATLVGHNVVRERAMGGDFDRAPTVDEMERMRAIVEQAMKDGALGLSTGLIYLPGTFSKTDEIVELAKAAAAYDGIYASHMRHEDGRIFGALEEVFQIARDAHVRAEISHLKLSGERAWGRAEKVLALIEGARSEGLDITQDVYAYTAASTGLRQTIPDWAFNGGRQQFLEFLRNPDARARLGQGMKEQLQARGRNDYAYAVVASNHRDKSLNGLNIAEAARKLRGSDSLEDQIETILTIEESGPAGAVFHGIKEEDMRQFLQHPNTMIGSDGGLYTLGEGVPHPRGYGNNARVLGRYVRELKALRLEEAIRKMTSLPADTFRLKERGQVREGFRADVVVFDADKVADTATYSNPHQYAAGIPHVLVNGVPVIRNGAFTGAKPGHGLRRKGDF